MCQWVPADVKDNKSSSEARKCKGPEGYIEMNDTKGELYTQINGRLGRGAGGGGGGQSSIDED